MAGDAVAHLGFAHHFVPGKIPRAATLLLLHGTGGNEGDLIPLAGLLDRDAAVLSPRGKVLEAGMPRWFRRIREGVFDEADLIARAADLRRFIEEAVTRYELDPGRVIAVGFSNGANMAAALHLLHPTVLRGSVLFRAMVPLEPAITPDLVGIPVFLAAGRHDPMIAPDNVERLATLLREAGADVTLSWEPQGHNLVAHEIDLARQWLASRRI